MKKTFYNLMSHIMPHSFIDNIHRIQIDRTNKEKHEQLQFMIEQSQKEMQEFIEAKSADYLDKIAEKPIIASELGRNNNPIDVMRFNGKDFYLTPETPEERKARLGID